MRLFRSLKGFPIDLYSRGMSYLERTRLNSHNDYALSFFVQGTRLYKVSLVNIGDDGLEANCTCPAFEEMDACKHVAACIMKADTLPFSSSFSGSVTYLGSTYFEEEFEHDFEQNWIPPAEVKDWKILKLESLLKPSTNLTSTTFFPVEMNKGIDELWYELQFYQTREDPVVEVSFRSRSILKSGSLGKIKRVTISGKSIEQIKNESDASILKSCLPYAQPQAYSSTFKFDKVALEKYQTALLKEILKTGRAFLRTNYGYDSDSTQIEPLEWNDELFSIILKSDMNSMTLGLDLTLDGKVLPQNSLKEMIVSKGFNLAVIGKRVFPFKTSLSRELLDYFFAEGVVSLSDENFAKFRDLILSSVDHNSIGGDRFGLPIRAVKPQIEVQVKLPLGKESVALRLVNTTPPPAPPFEFMTLLDHSEVGQIGQILKQELDVEIDDSGFFNVPIISFSDAIKIIDTLGVPVKAEKALIKATGTFNLTVSSGIDWFELSGSIETENGQIDLPKILSGLKNGQQLLEIKKDQFHYLPEAWLRKVQRLSEVGEYIDGKFHVHRSRALQLEEMAVSSVELTNYLGSLRNFKSLQKVRPARAFKGKLRDYQGLGLSWMKFLRQLGLGGCLADDMGLGKTVQVAANLQIWKQEQGKRDNVRPSLIVCPKSLVYNWHNELGKFCPDLVVHVFEGGKEEVSFDNCDILITTYGLVQRQCEKFSAFTFGYIVLDEAQAIKNARSLTSKAIFTLKGLHRLALTGTPIENHVGELFSIFNFLMPGVYKKEALNSNIASSNLVKSLRPFILRRTKAEVLKDLPDKIEQTLLCTPDPDEALHYRELKEFVSLNLNKEIEGGEFKKKTIVVLEALTRLRQAACHPGLINPNLKELETGKLQTLRAMLGEILSEGHKVLIFSQFTTLLQMFREKLSYDDQNSIYLDGDSKNRQALVDEFQTGNKKVFFISLKAGGTGLNLTQASYCFLLDPWWNPAVEDQAIGRLHRIGQKRSVNVYRLITKNTIEEKVLELQKLKKDVIKETLQDGSDGFIRSMTSKDLEFLLG